VLLQDPYDNKQYEIFMNDSQTERTAVRTEIAQDTPEAPPPAPGKDQKPPRKPPARSASPQDPAAAPEFIRQRLEREMIDQENDAASQQAGEDLENLQPLMPDLDEQGQEELERLKSEFEKMRQ
jgi:HAMP domain-containing protein